MCICGDILSNCKNREGLDEGLDEGLVQESLDETLPVLVKDERDCVHVTDVRQPHVR